ncbi:MAG: hypothetical protein HYY59_01180 [Candidatus Omnitrophica bacterium]|nr:hypothetical protein [Candidatus Omnitrophota bacterium]
MRRMSFLGFALLLVFGLATDSSAQPSAQERGAEAVPGEVLVKFTAEAARAIEAARAHGARASSGLAALDALLAQHGVSAIERVFPETTPQPSGLGIERWYRLRLAAGQGIEAAVSAFAQDPAHVEAAQPNYRIKLEPSFAYTQVPVPGPRSSSAGSQAPQLFGHLVVSGGQPGDRLSLHIGATDPDGDRLSLQLDERTPLPETAEVRTIAAVPGRLEAEVRWTPQATDTSRDLRFLVSDGTTPPVSAPPASFLVSAPVPPYEPPASDPLVSSPRPGATAPEPATEPQSASGPALPVEPQAVSVAPEPLALATVAPVSPSSEESLPPPQGPPLAPILPARSTMAAASTPLLASTPRPASQARRVEPLGAR